MKKESNPLECGFTIAVDTREQLPYDFESVTVSIHNEQVPIQIETVRVKLCEGDYSIAGTQHQIAVERKSIADAASTLTRGRKRFVNELERLGGYDYSAVVVEGEWNELMQYVYTMTQASPASVDSTIIALSQRFVKTHWVFRPGRWAAMKTTFKILDRFHRDHS